MPQPTLVTGVSWGMPRRRRQRAAIIGTTGAVGALLLAIGAALAPQPPQAARLSGPLPERDGLHNLWRVRPGVLSGSMPHGEDGFASLADLGVRTVISVDGARPDLERARASGLRTVHIPVRYSGITQEQRDALVIALRTIERPVYVHCHHGRHRGPSAIVLGLVSTGELDPSASVGLLESIGTSHEYAGLYRDVGAATAMPRAEVDGLDIALVPYAQVSGMTAQMAAVDRAFDHLEQLRDNGFRPLDHHPDLDARSEAAQLWRHLDELRGDPELASYPADFSAMLDASVVAAASLRDAFAGARSHAVQHLERLGQSCDRCHADYRDNGRRLQ